MPFFSVFSPDVVNPFLVWRYGKNPHKWGGHGNFPTRVAGRIRILAIFAKTNQY
jgi:hypothetical protein